jgi:hypothetical protein
MLVHQAKAIAAHWLATHAHDIPGFWGAFSAGSINRLDDAAPMPPTSDVDIMVVLADADPDTNPGTDNLPPKLGKFRDQGLLLEVTYLAYAAVASPAAVLGHYHLAGNLAHATLLADPTGALTEMQQAVARDFAQRDWVERRCRQAHARIVERLAALDTSAPLHNQVTTWLFAAGGMPHLLLVAGLQNPTVRTRYVAARTLLASYGQGDAYGPLLDLIDEGRIGPVAAAGHLAALARAFDAATHLVNPAYPFAADLSAEARPVAIDGSADLLARGDHREALFWIVATFSRCRHVLHAAASVEVRRQHDRAYAHLLADLGIKSPADLPLRADAVAAALPGLWATTVAILDANPQIHA